jgi:hypothetical protein
MRSLKKQNNRAASLLAVVALSGASVFAADYPTTVAADGPLAYYRLNDASAPSSPNLNIGSLGADGNATNLNVRPYPGAIVGSNDRAQFFDSSARSIIPFNAALNPDSTKPFTMEAWILPASDQINAGQSVINNRYAYSGAQRQGWVIFQRAPNDTYNGKPGYEGVGWNFRMYAGGNGIDVVAAVPYEPGSWVHFVAVYDPDDAEGKKTTLYINGVEVASKAGNYVANTDEERPEMVNGPAGLAFGAYNNTAVSNGQTSQSNPFFGAVDEFAFYTNKLTEAKILAHYQNATNAARTLAYDALVKQDNPVAYLRLNEGSGSATELINLGETRNGGNLPINEKTQVNAETALESDMNDHSLGVHRRDGGGTRASIPFNALNNPSEGTPMTVEAWVRPLNDRLTPGAAVLNNRKAAGNRSGWVVFQRSPNETYTGQPGNEGIGYNFRMYRGAGGSSGANITTSVPYTVGEWQHLVFTWTPDLDNGDGTWQGTLRAYVNGEPAGETSGAYHANTDPTDDDTALVDLAIGSYNAASNWGQEFDGNIDEVAIYNNTALTEEQIRAHYAAGTNAFPARSYSSLVLSAPYEAALAAADPDNRPTAQRMGPATYLRFNDAPRFPAANSGTRGAEADGAFQTGAGNTAQGPSGAGFAGFETGNAAGAFDGSLAWLALNNKDSLNFNGNITLEAWVQPAATQGEVAKIISHGPALLSLYGADVVTENASILTSPEVYLQVDGSGANYTAGASDGTNSVVATFPIPAGDLAGAWVHLVGTFDGANGKLYRNGELVATTAGTVTSMVITNGDWSIGSTGMGWKDYFSGAIDEPAIYNKALTAAQVKAHYDAATGAVVSNIHIDSYTQTPTTITLNWSGGAGKYLVQSKSDITSATWVAVQSTTGTTATVTKSGNAQYYRVQGGYTGPDVP